jgi:hypothetical protein
LSALRLQFALALLDIALEDRGAAHPLILRACRQRDSRHSGPRHQNEPCRPSKLHRSPEVLLQATRHRGRSSRDAYLGARLPAGQDFYLRWSPASSKNKPARVIFAPNEALLTDAAPLVFR